MSIHPLRLVAILLLAACVAAGAYHVLKPHTIAYVKLRQGVVKESGQRLEASDLERAELSLGGLFRMQSSPVPGLITWEEAPRFVGLPLARRVEGGRPLLAEDVERPGAAGQERALGASMTGISIPVDNVSGVTPYVAVGERVHVYASFEDDAGAHTGLLLKNMPIIGVQREMEGDHPRLKAVTLSLRMDEAVLLTHALHYGKIRLGQASPADGQTAGIGDAAFAAALIKTKKRWIDGEEERS
ncbi:pilus assembly protein CpaB [Brevibacillus aydinogluensis]|mgnify:CR=1 FL=1|jgi:pilus assembly protein CpaB|uniref:Pilus assembly protein CpaB n=1 Tax=Brevibacillus aydinogluensis TaxID=927786 RepID=A0AA48MB10_9BACL|nr:RcpC/CpaB family pilus assembly protein [Brevibacillus aydinogluensis]MDT3416794.1 pilus assembly protein CpaB [Brevibacillus aydinogluensis]REK67436.1 MAG: pilus assembly protein CpaB [Brevibacillus sp.]CAJ1004568.1 Pilus assembly protein CpaB [Brevibacillus aydinogluensis]